MENATKALLIAGSILVVIILISVGVKLLNSTSDTTEASQSTMKATAITTFNTQFTSYLNKDLTKSQVSTLLQKIIASNAVNKDHPVKFKGTLTIPSTSDAGKYTADYKDGYITNIK